MLDLLIYQNSLTARTENCEIFLINFSVMKSLQPQCIFCINILVQVFNLVQRFLLVLMKNKMDAFTGAHKKRCCTGTGRCYIVLTLWYSNSFGRAAIILTWKGHKSASYSNTMLLLRSTRVIEQHLSMW